MKEHADPAVAVPWEDAPSEFACANVDAPINVRVPGDGWRSEPTAGGRSGTRLVGEFQIAVGEEEGGVAGVLIEIDGVAVLLPPRVARVMAAEMLKLADEAQRRAGS